MSGIHTPNVCIDICYAMPLHTRHFVIVIRHEFKCKWYWTSRGTYCTLIHNCNTHSSWKRGRERKLKYSLGTQTPARCNALRREFSYEHYTNQCWTMCIHSKPTWHIPRIRPYILKQDANFARENLPIGTNLIRRFNCVA